MRASPEAPPRDPGRYCPLFVLAAARSYSSVVTTMIGQHPELAGLPELKLFCYRTMGELEASLPRFWAERGVTHRSPGLVRAVAQFVFGDQRPESTLMARAWLKERSDWTGADVLDLLLERLHPRIAVEKSPENVATDEALERLAAAYPEARYLHLTRHPVATQRSLQAHWSRTLPGYSAEDEPMAGIASWVEVQCRILQFAATLPQHRYKQVKAEDVLNESHSQLRSIASWLGVSTADDAIAAMTHPEESPFATFGPADGGIAGGNDANFLRDPRPRRVEVFRAVEKPAGWEENAALWEMTVEVAERLGYC